MTFIVITYTLVVLCLYYELFREFKIRKELEDEIPRAYWRGRDTGKRLERERHK